MTLNGKQNIILIHTFTVIHYPDKTSTTALDLRSDAPSQFFVEPATCQLYYWREDTGLISHLSFIGQFEGPYPFFDKEGRLID